MGVIYSLSAAEIDIFNAFSSISSATFTSGNLTELVETWGSYTKTTTITYSSGNIATLTVAWVRA